MHLSGTHMVYIHIIMGYPGTNSYLRKERCTLKLNSNHLGKTSLLFNLCCLCKVKPQVHCPFCKAVHTEKIDMAIATKV